MTADLKTRKERAKMKSILLYYDRYDDYLEYIRKCKYEDCKDKRMLYRKFESNRNPEIDSFIRRNFKILTDLEISEEVNIPIEKLPAEYRSLRLFKTKVFFYRFNGYCAMGTASQLAMLLGRTVESIESEKFRHPTRFILVTEPSDSYGLYAEILDKYKEIVVPEEKRSARKVGRPR